MFKNQLVYTTATTATTTTTTTTTTTVTTTTTTTTTTVVPPPSSLLYIKHYAPRYLLLKFGLAIYFWIIHGLLVPEVDSP
jgi:hypothetical protein